MYIAGFYSGLFFPHGAVILLLENDRAMNFILKFNVSITVREKWKVLLLLACCGDGKDAFRKIIAEA